MSYTYSMYDKCCCCDENVGIDDAKTIFDQVKNCEKICMWCGDGFDITDDERTEILEDSDLSALADRLNEVQYHRTPNEIDFDYHKNVRTSDEDRGKIKKRAFEKKKKEAIKVYFGIDTDVEKFDPGYADAHGKPHDRINDAVPYEEMRKKDYPHRVLLYIDQNPNCTGSGINKNVGASRLSKFKKLPHHPISRLYASKLIDCTSEFIGFVDMSSMAERFPSGYFGKMPRFSRKYIITPHGKGVLAEFEKGRKEVLL